MKKYNAKVQSVSRVEKVQGRNREASNALLDIEVPVPDVPTGKWESQMWAKLTKPVRMRYYQQLIDGETDWAGVWKAINTRKNWSNTLDYMRMALNVEPDIDVTSYIYTYIYVSTASVLHVYMPTKIKIIRMCNVRHNTY